MRDEMPSVAAFIDQMREAFGKEGIDAAIRGGMRGKPTFWASEGGREIGTRMQDVLYVELFGPDRETRRTTKTQKARKRHKTGR